MDPESKDNGLLEDAVAKNDIRSMKKLLAAAKRCDMKCIKRALTRAVEANNVDAVQLLLDHVNLLHITDALWTVFSAAAEAGRNALMIVTAAIKLRGISVPSAALYWAAAHGLNEVIKHLLDNGVDVNSTDLHRVLHAAALYGHADCLKTLLQHGVDVNSADGLFVDTALDAAAWNGHDCLTTLIEHGADVNAGAGDWTPFHSAAFYGHTECVTALLQHGADINIRSSFGDTPLHEAAIRGHVDCFKKLVQYGADTTLRNKRNKTALDVAKQSTKLEMQIIVETSQSQNYSSQETDTKYSCKII